MKNSGNAEPYGRSKRRHVSGGEGTTPVPTARPEEDSRGKNLLPGTKLKVMIKKQKTNKRAYPQYVASYQQNNLFGRWGSPMSLGSMTSLAAASLWRASLWPTAWGASGYYYTALDNSRRTSNGTGTAK